MTPGGLQHAYEQYRPENIVYLDVGFQPYGYGQQFPSELMNRLAIFKSQHPNLIAIGVDVLIEHEALKPLDC